MGNPAGSGIVKRQTKDYNFSIKDDGTDYFQIWSDFREGRIPDRDCTQLRAIATVDVYLFKAHGQQFIFKTDRGYPHHIDSKLWRILTGPFYSNQMRSINKAVNSGSTVTADFYLVAEKRTGLISRESHILMEYLQGHPLREEKDTAAFHDALVELFQELHRNKMAMCDVHTDNIFVTEQGLRTIDLSWRGVFWTGKGKDILALKERMGIIYPDQTISDRLSVLYVRLMFWIRYTLRGFRKYVKSRFLKQQT